ncbi:lectin [Mycena metata]|uniref:Lectin n=1 Tax=Mycena metata TaxID=1033252 RepID=A0AAD7JTC7_9AGAR|nr:lectin [Mycena metata]
MLQELVLDVRKALESSRPQRQADSSFDRIKSSFACQFSSVNPRAFLPWGFVRHRTSKWIWTNEVTQPGGDAPIGARAFRKDFTPPLGKTPAQADIIMTVDNGLTLYVNGGQVGTGGDFRFAEHFCVALRPCLNVFAVTGLNAGVPLACLPPSKSHTPTAPPPLSFPTPLGAIPLRWTPAIAQGAYGVAPWGQITIPSTTPVLSLTAANWIWTSEVVNGNAPAGARYFRRTYYPPTGQTVTSATVIIVADDAYSLTVNGVPVGSGTDFHIAQTYTVNLAPAPYVVFAVVATNGGTVNNPAGLLVAVEIMSQCNCISGAYFISDGSWKFNTGTSVGFELPGFDDSKWPAAVIEGP